VSNMNLSHLVGDTVRFTPFDSDVMERVSFVSPVSGWSTEQHRRMLEGEDTRGKVEMITINEDHVLYLVRWQSPQFAVRNVLTTFSDGLDMLTVEE